MNYKEGIYYLANKMRLVKFNEKSVYVQARYGPSKVIKLPLKINEDLSCLSAIIIGDGHLSKDKFRTTIESSSSKLLEQVSKMAKLLFDIKTTVKKIKKREGKKQTYYLSIYSKAVQELFNIIFGIQRGNKSNFVRIPKQILPENKEIKNAFIIGLLVAEGSRKGKKEIRICSASKLLLEDTKKMLTSLKIESKIKSWINQKYKKEYYCISFKRVCLDSFMRGCRSGQTGQILSIFKKVIEDHA